MGTLTINFTGRFCFFFFTLHFCINVVVMWSLPLQCEYMKTENRNDLVWVQPQGHLCVYQREQGVWRAVSSPSAVLWVWVITAPESVASLTWEMETGKKGKRLAEDWKAQKQTCIQLQYVANKEKQSLSWPCWCKHKRGTHYRSSSFLFKGC